VSPVLITFETENFGNDTEVLDKSSGKTSLVSKIERFVSKDSSKTEYSHPFGEDVIALPVD
tara:strand:- start:282 stop:464 length:183 start_codon:yes stop_codon:yes gene_type:complete